MRLRCPDGSWGASEIDALIPPESRKSNDAPTTFKPSTPYIPPTGFEPATITSSFKTRNLFAKENLRGKQIWHITAPASVHISAIKEVPIQKVATGESILSYKGADYGLVTEADEDCNEKVLLVPSSNDNTYHLASTGIARTLHLQQIVKLPSSDKSANRGNGSKEPPRTHVKAVRQQPEGLRMRYRPFGDVTSSDDSDPAPRFKVPPILSPTKSSNKAKPVAKISKASSTKESVEPVENISKGNSKDKPTKHVRTPQLNRTSSSSFLELAWKSSFGNSSNAKENKRQADPTPTHNFRYKETPDEKTKRREEKKRRREPKASGAKVTVGADGSPKSSSKNRMREESAVTANGVKDVHANQPEPEEVRSKKNKRVSETTDGKDVCNFNKNKDANSKDPEPEKAKAKRKKRKSEATPDA